MFRNEKSLIDQFSLSQLGIDEKKFINRLEGTFPDLAFDLYDARLAKINFLKEQLPQKILELDAEFGNYYSGELPENFLKKYVDLLPFEVRENFERISPFRKRGIAFFEAYDEGHGNICVKENKNVPFSQKTRNYLNIPRHFKSIDSEILNDKDYQMFIVGITGLVRKRKNFDKLNITIHHMHSIVYGGQEKVSNSPEGIHQDGVEYIVSACVIGRKNVNGGVSKVYKEDKREVLLETCLEPGQGLFHPDSGSPLWHEVTPIHLTNSNMPYGFRSIIGFDIDSL